MDFSEKMSKVMEASKLSIGAIETECGISNKTLRSAIDDNRFPTQKIIEKLLDGMRINRIWWETGTGDIFLPGNQAIEKKLDPESIYRDLVEANSDYRLVPKTILEEEYRIVLKSQLDQERKIIDVLLEAKDKVISQLESEINELRRNVVLHPKKA